ncbi:hypothetical protein VHEMI10707 [[Torrubiella] hemipterigena]|uniref:Endonuclease/exonuclease/phosphatase domain-containing protein n=1 Tax=[Torrubiella] hemipterigena TaxID=1531966 RepID=A0A0A1TTN3_9HYPO|nr:hypothetical protein VHEMI10707 [[Torrubiella] hemipterigena]
MTYIKHAPHIQATQICSFDDRDILGVQVNNLIIVNFYNQGKTGLKKLLSWEPPNNTVIAGDFNATYALWQTTKNPTTEGALIAQWVENNDLDVLTKINTPTIMGTTRQRNTSTIDLTLSNIPGASSTVEEHLTAGSLHHTISTEIPSQPRPPYSERKFRLTTDEEYDKYRSLVESAAKNLPTAYRNKQDLENLAASITKILQDALKIAGRKASGYRPLRKPWWNEEYQAAYITLRIIRSTSDNPTSLEVQLARRDLQRAVRTAQRNGFRKYLDEIQDPSDVYKITKWTKPIARFEPPPIQIGEELYISDKERAQALLQSKLATRDASDDIDLDIADLTQDNPFPWDDTISKKEVQDALLSTGNTTPGMDNITTKILRAA